MYFFEDIRLSDRDSGLSCRAVSNRCSAAGDCNHGSDFRSTVDERGSELSSGLGGGLGGDANS